MNLIIDIRKKSVAILIILLVFTSVQVVTAENILPPDLNDVSIKEHLGDKVPFKAEFLNEKGERVTLGSFFESGKPILINLVYYECPMLCNLVLNGMSAGLNEMRWTPGNEFDIVTISIDADETPELAREKKEVYLNTLNKKESAKGWHFLTGTDENIKMVTGAIGFSFNKVGDKDIAHGAALYLTSPSGTLSRYLYGIQYSGIDIKRGLLDAMDGKQVSVVDKVLMFCYRYSKESRGYVLFADNFMTGSGYFVLMFILGFFSWLWYHEFKRKKKKVSAPVSS